MGPRVTCQIVDEGGERFFGPGPAMLLRGLERTGSLSAAARELSLSYSKATRMLKEAEASLGVRLTTRQIGGEGGGFSQLTDEGARILERYEAWSDAVRAEGMRLFDQCFSGVDGRAAVAVAVLANGRSERFGSQKLLADLDGRCVLDRTLDAVEATGLPRVVAAGPGPVAEAVAARAIPTVAPAGPDQSDSMRAAIAALGDAPAIVFVQGDQPLLQAQDLLALVERSRLEPDRPVRLSEGGEPRSPILFPSSLKGALLSITGDVGGGALLRDRPDLAASTVLVEAQGVGDTMDVDTPEALAEAARILAARETRGRG